MNYLSHFFITQEAKSEIHLGNFLGDILRYKDTKTLSKNLMEGVLIHRVIDKFTDSHPLVKTGNKIIAPTFGRYSSVVLDVYFDFILIDNWEQFSSKPLPVFLDECYVFLEAHLNLVPTRVLPQVKAMIEARWMDGYLLEKGRNDVFRRLDKRAKFETKFAQAMSVYAENIGVLTSLHEKFFPELINRVKLIS